MSPIVVAISGKKGSGKDTSASRLIDKWGFRKISFADPLKRCLKETFGFSDEQLYGNLKETIDPFWGITPRSAMEDVGMFFREKFGPDFWIKSTSKNIENQQKASSVQLKFVIADLRFFNELEFAKSFEESIVWRMTREDIVLSSHISETELDKYSNWDSILDNNSSMKDLFLQVDNAYLQFINKDKEKYAFNKRTRISV